MTHCNHFVARKKRYCRISVVPGAPYCAEHQPPKVETSGGKIRIDCPLDPKHTCYVHNLAKHLKVCNSRPQPLQPFIQKGVNSGGGVYTSNRLLSEFSTDAIRGLVTRIKDFATDVNPNITEKFLSHKSLRDDLGATETGSKSRKHLAQAAAILGILDENFPMNETCFVEFGAGRGLLSYYLAQTAPTCSYVLVERASPKHKRDNKLEGIVRIRADITDLVLHDVDAVKSKATVIGITKHLCGDATDLALHCLMNSSKTLQIGGCVMSFCCHHRCRWSSYTGRTYLESAQFSKDDFDMMCGMSSWGTCGTGLSRERRLDNVDCLNERDKAIGLNRQEKEEIGLKAKMVLNWGRMRFLQDKGFDAQLCYYVSRDISLENVCVIATQKKLE